ncbi:uncharacterized protein LOC108248306 isoform X2 [Kryptolebias marmoratus]|uniref:Protein FAM111A-like n=1 Tax=Kryptolebias marmoratus TaxID=37003 RepID=A0A3Q3B8C3_KRYMA|nr:uncharacterized protein LOC108248306 isoform X2 [Kryptolebias marmoratus]
MAEAPHQKVLILKPERFKAVNSSCSADTKVKMTSRKRKRTDSSRGSRAFRGKENEDPEGISPSRKQPKMAEVQSVLKKRSSNLSTSKTKRNCTDEMDKENREPEVSTSGKLSPRTPRVDSHFPKIYKKCSPTKKQGNAETPSSSIAGVIETTDIWKKLKERSKSVCNIIVVDICQGTGFVAKNNLIMTNAHLFRDHMEGKKLKSGVNVIVFFYYNDGKCFYFPVEKVFAAINYNLDYALLELRTEGQMKESREVPPGLLETLAPEPENGVVYIIGHPKGGAKKTDQALVVEVEKRKQTYEDHLAPHQELLFLRLSIVQLLNNQGIEDVMIGGVKANQVVTYRADMYEGSSGSPVFDANGQVCGLHTGGFWFGFPHTKNGVFSYAKRLSVIFQDLVRQLKESGNEQLLKDFVASNNEYLKRLLSGFSFI